MPEKVSRIAELRSRQGLTQQQLANEIGVTSKTIANWESDRCGVYAIASFVKLCQVLGCSPDELLKCNSESPVQLQ